MIKSPPVEGFSFAAKPSGYTAEEIPIIKIKEREALRVSFILDN